MELPERDIQVSPDLVLRIRVDLYVCPCIAPGLAVTYFGQPFGFAGCGVRSGVRLADNGTAGEPRLEIHKAMAFQAAR